MADIADQAEWLTDHERTENVRRVQLAMLPSPVFDCAGSGGMTPTNYISAAALVVAALAMVINLVTMVRAGQWRNSDDGKAVSLKISDLRRDVTIIQTRMEALPTADDIAKLTTEVSVMRAVSNANHDLLIMTRNQLNRIEGFFLEAKP